MSRRVTPIFATRGDLSQLLHAVSSVSPIEVYLGGLCDSATVAPVPLESEFERLKIYLLVRQGVPVRVRPVPQRRGGEKYAVDQRLNSHSVVLRPGGLAPQRCIVAGQIGTTSDASESLELYALVASTIRAHFEKTRSFYVGSEALALQRAGYRLKASETSPRLHDLAEADEPSRPGDEPS